MKLGLITKEKGKQTKKAAKYRYMKENFPISFLLRAWEREGKDKKKPQRSRYKDEIPDFLFQTCMSKVRNTGILSYISLNWYIMRNTKI